MLIHEMLVKLISDKRLEKLDCSKSKSMKVKDENNG